MPKQEKVDRVAELKARIEGSDALLLTEYRGLTVSDITELRRSLSEGGARFSVVKNTLMRRAANAAAMAELEALFEGPTAVAFVAGDPVAAAKSVVEAAKKYPSLVLKGGWMEGRPLSAEEARALADLESREVMLSKIAGLLKGEMSRAASMFTAAQSRFLSLLDAYAQKLPGDEPGPADAAVEAAPADEVQTAEETPTPEEASAAEETPTAEEAPAAEEAPTPEGAVADQEPEPTTDDAVDSAADDANKEE